MINVLLLNPVYVTLFWALVLHLHRQSSHRPKIFLGWFMIVASQVYLSHFFYFTQNYNVYFYFDSIYTLAYLLVYPMYHIYVRLLTVDSHFSLKKHFKFLLIPFILFFLKLTGYIIMGKESGMEYITQVLVGGAKPQGMFKLMKTIFMVGRFVFLGQTVFYLIFSFVLIRQNNIKIQDYYSNTDERRLNWLQFFNISFAFTSMSSAVLAALGRNFFLENTFYLLIPSIVFTVMLFVIGLLGNYQRAIFTEIDSKLDAQDEGKPPLRLKSKLDALFEKEKVYKNPDLKIWDISSMLGTNRTYVSRIINSEYNRNFCSHVNHYRIEHAKSLVMSNPNLTHEQIAELSGFGSVNSLARAFQTKEGVTLGQFRRKVEGYIS